MRRNVFMVSLMAAAAAGAIPVSYEDFGAVGDGVHDDRLAIVAAHAAANAKGLPVRAKDGATYYVGAGTNTALVATDVDFGTARFIVDDRKVRVEDRSSPLFRVVSLKPSVELKGLGAIRAGQKNLGVRLPAKCFVYLKCDKVRRYFRKGLNQNNGTPQQEALIVEANGDVDPSTPVLWDYPEVTAALARPIDEKHLTIRGGDFLTRANQAESKYNYHLRDFAIERSNVLVEKVTHRISDESDHGAPYRAFVLVDKCAYVTVKDCVFQAHKTYWTIGSAKKPVPMGSYDLSAEGAVNVSYVNCRQTTDISDNAYWGLFGSNFCKNLLFDGCAFSRFDAHMGVAGATVRNSMIGYMGLSSIGCGTFLVENTTVCSRGFVNLRSDYGSTWDGRFVIRNCRFEPTKPGQRIGAVVCGSNDGTHDFGYICHLPEIEVDGLFIDDRANPGEAVLFGDIGGGLSAEAKFPVVPPARVVLKNVTTASGRPVKTFAKPEAFRETKVETVAGLVSVVCAEPGTWAFDVSSSVQDGCDVVKIRLTSPVEAVPPAFDARFETSGADVLQVWTPYDERCQLWPQAWGTARYESALAFRAPLCAAFNNRDRNRCALAVSDAFHRINYALTIHERTCRLKGHVSFFQAKESPRKSYEVRLRIDRRDVFWGDAVREASDWVSRTSGLKPADVPEAAFEPLYSTWYAFWQDVRAPEIEREAKAAAALGMKTAILDDGWQKEKSRTYYSATGDWMPVASRFPDMRAHVEKVHAAGLKYMLWLSVPFVGDESKAYARFRGKFLSGDGTDTAALDPRFPEVREYLLTTYERAVRDWGFDGLKLDFIDLFRLPEVDPALADDYAGRDYRSLPEATDRLMRDVVSRLKAIRPDILLEFRQQYMGPAIRQYGNMIRATDCPADPAGNRRRIADLRLTSGTTAVHSDMLVWSVDETPENAARSVLSALFGVVQYSMVLGRVPPAHREMMRHWIDFSTRHRSALLKGMIRPHHPEMQYPWIESWDDRERIVAAYVENTVLPVPADGRETILINAAQDASLVVDLAAASAEAEAFDTFGKSAGRRTLVKGLQRVAVPPSGYLKLAKGLSVHE